MEITALVTGEGGPLALVTGEGGQLAFMITTRSFFR